MPNGDGTGLVGKGTMTGRGYGPCNPNYSGQQANMGRGSKNQGRNCPNLERMPAQDEITLRKQQQKLLEKQLQTVNNRISELEQK